MSHNELLGIALNIRHIESGDDRFNEILTRHPDIDYFTSKKRTYWDRQFGYFKLIKYQPENCNKFCPYKDSCIHTTNILSTMKPPYGTMERIAGYEEKLYTLDESVSDLEKSILSAIAANDNMIHVIKAPTSTGKTEICLNIMQNSDLNFLYANPTNILKDDVHRRAEEKGINALRTPSLHDKEMQAHIPHAVKHHIDHLYNSGRYRSVDHYISKVAAEQDIECLKEYLNEKNKFHKYKGHVIATHRKLLNMDGEALGKFDVRIIDEDFILKTVIPNQVSIPVKDLKKLIKLVDKDFLAGSITQSNYNRIYKKIAEALKLSKTETMFTLDSFAWEPDNDKNCPKAKKESLDDDTPTPIDVSSFCLAEKFYFRKASEERNLKEDTLVYLKPIQLKKGFKYIIISATADEDIYKRYFGSDRIKFYECKKAKYAGILEQFYDKSMSRYCIRTNPGIIEKIKQLTGENPILT